MSYPEPIIIIVDDDAEVRGSIQSFLRSCGLVGVTYADAESLLEADTIGDATCLLTDVQMPGMSGLELLGLLREQGEKLPIFVMSAFDQDRVEPLALAGGAQGFFSKPVDMDALMRRLEICDPFGGG